MQPYNSTVLWLLLLCEIYLWEIFTEQGNTWTVANTGWNIKEPSVNDTVIREVSVNKTFRWAKTGLACNTSQSYVKYESFPKLQFESSRSVRTDRREEDEPMQILCIYLLLEHDWSHGGGAPSHTSLKASIQAVHLRSVIFLLHRQRCGQEFFWVFCPWTGLPQCLLNCKRSYILCFYDKIFYYIS